MPELIHLGGHALAALADNAQYECRFEIPSSDGERMYVVARRKSSGAWSCGCPGWIRWRRCKHLRALAPYLAQLAARQTPRALPAPGRR